jgi:hypothetical protein
VDTDDDLPINAENALIAVFGLIPTPPSAGCSVDPPRETAREVLMDSTSLKSSLLSVIFLRAGAAEVSE